MNGIDAQELRKMIVHLAMGSESKTLKNSNRTPLTRYTLASLPG